MSEQERRYWSGAMTPEELAAYKARRPTTVIERNEERQTCGPVDDAGLIEWAKAHPNMTIRVGTEYYADLVESKLERDALRRRVEELEEAFDGVMGERHEQAVLAAEYLSQRDALATACAAKDAALRDLRADLIRMFPKAKPEDQLSRISIALAATPDAERERRRDAVVKLAKELRLSERAGLDGAARIAERQLDDALAELDDALAELDRGDDKPTPDEISEGLRRADVRLTDGGDDDECS